MQSRFDIVQTGILGSAIQQCGYEFDFEDDIDTYQFDSYVSEGDDLKESLYQAEGYLEDTFSTNMGRIYTVLSIMSKSWNSNKKLFEYDWQEDLSKKMWIHVKNLISNHLHQFYEENEFVEFMKIGHELFEN